MNPTQFIANLFVSLLPANASDDMVIGAALVGLTVFGILIGVVAYFSVKLMGDKK